MTGTARNGDRPPPPGAGTRGPDGELEPITVDSLPGLARVAATSLWRTSSWAASTYVRAGRRLVGVALRPETAVELADDLRHVASEITRTLIGDEVAERVAPDREPEARPPARTLHGQGEDLLRRSRDVRYEEPAHPAYERMMDELAPDEARILLLLLRKGPQPSIDVRTGGPVGVFSSRLVAPGLNMIGARAGCRYVERVPAYLNNLHRLGLVWFSRETLRDPTEYQVVEAQPDVLAAMHKVRYAKIVRRSIHLTPFGEDFCRSALAVDTLTTTEFASLPEHGAPDDDLAQADPPSVG